MLIANDKNDPTSAAHCIVEGMDAIDDTIPSTPLQLATCNVSPIRTDTCRQKNGSCD